MSSTKRGAVRNENDLYSTPAPTNTRYATAPALLWLLAVAAQPVDKR